MTTWKTIALTRRIFVDSISAFNMLYRLVIAFLPRNKHLDFMAAVTIRIDFRAQKNKISHCFSIYLPWSDGAGKGQFSFQSQSKAVPKKCSNYRTIALISHASKVMLKILQARIQQYMKCDLLDIQAGFRKGRGTRDQIANIHWIIKKAREFQKNSYFCFIDYTKAFDCVNHNKL